MVKSLEDELLNFDFNPISLDSKEIITQFLESYSPKISEYTFTNIFMWRKYYNFYWKVFEENLFIISLNDPKKITAFPPIGKSKINAVNYLLKITNNIQNPLEIIRAPEEFVEKLYKNGLKINYVEDRNNWDYIYRTDDLLNLPGKNYANVRKKLNKFKRTYNWEFQILDNDTISKCLELQEDWCNLKSCSDEPTLEHEDWAIKDIFHNWVHLNFSGIVLFVDNKIIGYSLGEKLNSETYVCHVEKVNPQFYGGYQIINQLMAKYLASEYKLINREQDLGEINLRQSKLRYHPVLMGKKFTINFLDTISL